MRDNLPMGRFLVIVLLVVMAVYVIRLPLRAGKPWSSPPPLPPQAAQPGAVQPAAYAARRARPRGDHAPHVLERRHEERPWRDAARLAHRRGDRRAAAALLPLRVARDHRAAPRAGLLGARPRFADRQLPAARHGGDRLLRERRHYRLAPAARGDQPAPRPPAPAGARDAGPRH